MRLLRSRKWRAATIVFAVVLVTLAGAIYRNWGNIQPHLIWYSRNVAFRTGSDPIQRRLASGDIRPGDSIEELIETDPPRFVMHHGEFATAFYGPPSITGYTEIAAIDGRIVRATDRRTIPEYLFFDTCMPGELRRYVQSRNAYISQIPTFQKNAALAVAGFGATFDPCLPQPVPER